MDETPTDLELKLAAALIFMPEIGHLTAGVTKEIISRCARVATDHFCSSPPGHITNPPPWDTAFNDDV